MAGDAGAARDRSAGLRARRSLGLDRQPRSIANLQPVHRQGRTPGWVGRRFTLTRVRHGTDEPEGETGDAHREIDSDLTDQGNRLQHHRSSGAADQGIGTTADAEGHIAAGTNVSAGKLPTSKVSLLRASTVQRITPPAVNPTSRPNRVIVPE